MRDSRRYLGLELAGAKNQKTAIAALEYYPKERKTFLLDIYDRITGHEDQTGDEALLEVLEELGEGVSSMGVNVPLELPPCVTCVRKSCPLSEKCSVPAVKWMREFTRKMERNPKPSIRVKKFTPYTQRPVELWARYQILSELPEAYRFEIDETLGGNKAPLTARMMFLKRHLGSMDLIEAWPKLTVALLAEQLELPRRVIEKYRHLEDGAYARQDILDALIQKHGVFIYERDLKKLSASLTAFDAFICAYTALLSDRGECAKVPTGFPVASGWVEYPRLGAKPRGI